MRFGSILPSCSTVNNVEHEPCNLALGQTDLDHGITLTDRHRVVLESIEINSDGKRNAELIRSRIPPTEGSSRLIDTGGQITLHKFSPDLIDNGVDLRARTDGKHGALIRRNGWLELHNNALFIALALVEGVLKERVENTAHTERGLNDGGSELNLAHLLRRLGPSEHILGNLKAVDSCLSIGLKCCGNRLKGSPRLGQSLKCTGNDTLILTEGLAEGLAIKLELGNLNILRRVQTLRRKHGRFGLLGVHGQIVASTVSVTNAFHPTVRGLDLQIPTIAGVVCHLRLEMLTESHTSGVHTNLLHEKLRTGHKVAQSFIVDKARLDCRADGQGLGLTRAQLIVTAEENELLVRNRGEAGMRLVVRIDKVLDFTHAELTDTEKAGTRGDLVTESKADLSSGEGHLSSIGIEQTTEVDEEALRRLGTEVADGRTLGTDAGFEHEIEGEGITVGLTTGGLAVVLIHEEVVNLLGRVGVGLTLDAKVVLALLLGHVGRRLDEHIDGILQKLVGTETLASFRILHHKIGESLDVAGRLQDDGRGETGALHLQH
mmetsp:Transcript_20111/g.57714  ORF Transcript_20111/g.57714 Transcript_20111/m.57714 type:complete len:547 (-) Transcript_20111:435-2075(-)